MFSEIPLSIQNQALYMHQLLLNECVIATVQLDDTFRGNYPVLEAAYFDDADRRFQIASLQIIRRKIWIELNLRPDDQSWILTDLPSSRVVDAENLSAEAERELRRLIKVARWWCRVAVCAECGGGLDGDLLRVAYERSRLTPRAISKSPKLFCNGDYLTKIASTQYYMGPTWLSDVGIGLERAIELDRLGVTQDFLVRLADFAWRQTFCEVPFEKVFGNTTSAAIARRQRFEQRVQTLQPERHFTEKDIARWLIQLSRRRTR